MVPGLSSQGRACCPVHMALAEAQAKADRERPQQTPNAILSNRIQRSVKAELVRRGLAVEPAAGADLLVTYDIALRHGMRVYHTGWGHPYRGFWWGPGPYAWGGWGGVTWEPPWGWRNVAVIAHEMGHAFGIKRGLVVNRARRHIDFTADNRLYPCRFCLFKKFYSAKHRSMIGNGDSLHIKLGRAPQKIINADGAV